MAESKRIAGAEMVAAFRMDINEQPAAFHTMLDAYCGRQRDDLNAVAQVIGAAERPPVLLGMGTSQYLAMSACYSFAAQGILASAPEAGEWVHYLSAAGKGAPLVIVSCSGESAECVRVVNESRGSQPLFGIVNEPKSTVGQRTDRSLPMFCGPIRSSTTTGVTNPLAILQLVAHQIAGTFTCHADALRRVADAMAARLTADIGMELYEFLGRPGYADVIGRGPAYGMARTAGMLLREMIPLRGDSMPAASFRHGPLLDAGPDHTLFAVASGHTGGLVHAIAAETAAKGSRVLLITDQPAQNLGDRVKVVSVPNLGEECFCHLALQIIEQYIAATVERHGTNFILEVTTTE